MPDSLFLEVVTPHQTLPLVSSPPITENTFIDISQWLYPLANGQMARVVDTYVDENGARHQEIIFEVISADGSSIVQRHELAVNTDEDVLLAGPRFVAAPDGSLAVRYSLYTSSEEVSVIHTVSEDGSTISGPVTLVPPAGGRVGSLWYQGGGEFLATVYTEDPNQFPALATIVSFAADGTAIPGSEAALSGQFVDSFQLADLQDDRTVVGWTTADYTYNTSSLLLQLLDADGAADGTSILLQEWNDLYFGISGSNSYRLVSFADGSFGIVLQNTANGERSVVFQPLDTTGTPTPDLVTLTASANLIDAIVFEDGTMGVVSVTSDGYVYQRVDAAGVAVSDSQLISDLFYISDLVLLPQGGVAFTAYDYGDAEQTTIQGMIFDIDGQSLGPAFDLVTFDAGGGYTADLTVRADGEVLFDWYHYSTRQERVLVGHSPVTFRQLTDGDDSETLTNPEAIKAGDGDDQIIGSDGTDRLIGEAGDDVLNGGAGDDFVSGGTGTNVLDGGAGTDAAYFDAIFDSFTFVANADGSEVTLTGADSVDTLIGIEQLVFTDSVIGQEQMLVEAGFYDDTLIGTDGDDTLDGGIGSDTLLGGLGNDTLFGGDGTDTLNGGDGDDFIFGGSSSADLRDLILAGAGADSVDGGYGNDEIFGQDGDDTIAGGFGSDTLQGQNGNDVITGSALSDLVFGNDGDDFVNGGFGHDRINGGAGADRFYHLGIREHGSDWVQDYNAAEGDILLFGLNVTVDQFNVNFAHTENAEGERSGDDTVAEAFVTYQGRVIWALVDGQAQDEIIIKIDGELFDLLG